MASKKAAKAVDGKTIDSKMKEVQLQFDKTKAEFDDVTKQLNTLSSRRDQLSNAMLTLHGSLKTLQMLAEGK